MLRPTSHLTQLVTRPGRSLESKTATRHLTRLHHQQALGPRAAQIGPRPSPGRIKRPEWATLAMGSGAALIGPGPCSS